MHKKGISLNSVQKSLSHSADKIRRRTLLCFERILVSKSFKQRRGEASRFCQKIFYLKGPKKLRQGTALCFRKFLVGKNILWIRGGGGGITIFRRSFCLTVPKYFIGEHFGVSQKILLSKIFMHRRGGWHHGFVGIFCLTGPKQKALKRNSSVFRNFSGIEKNLWIRGGLSRFSVEIFMSHSVENFRKGILLFLRKFLVSKKVLWMKRGVSRFSVENFWSHSAEKFRGHPFNVSENLGYRKI